MTHRRGNGLLAETYLPLIVLSTAWADQMLDVLRDRGIAAYAVQLDAGAVEDAEAEEESATDHLYVDARERAAAEEILRDQLPDLEHRGLEPGGAETGEGTRRQARAEPEAGSGSSAPTAGDDDVWADLVARFYDTPTAEEAAWPDAENLSSDRRTAPGPGDAAEPDDREDEDADDSPRARVVRPAEPGDDHEHFVPPPPPPLPRGDLTSRLSWAGLFGGPLLLLGSMLLGTSLPGWLAFLAVAGFIAGFVVLVVRMGDRPRGDDGPDDGAVV